MPHNQPTNNPPQPPAQPSTPAPTPADPTLGHAALQAPWRYAYLEALDNPPTNPASNPTTPAAPTSPPPDHNFLLRYWNNPQADLDNHIILRTPRGRILLNAYPYANGHLLVALAEPRPRLLDYTPAQRSALWQLVDAAADLVESALNPQGLNIGINQGRAAGAGVPQHLHVHLVPRWAGDINFTTVVARVRVIPASLDVMAKRYRDAWPRLAPNYAHLFA